MNTEPPIRVVVADDHPVFRSGLRTMVQESPLLEYVGEAAGGQQAIALCEEKQPDAAVIHGGERRRRSTRDSMNRSGDDNADPEGEGADNDGEGGVLFLHQLTPEMVGRDLVDNQEHRDKERPKRREPEAEAARGGPEADAARLRPGAIWSGRRAT